MLPSDPATTSRTIFINPNFSKLPLTHINPKFFRPQQNPSIHINPNFLPKEPLANPQIQLAAAPLHNSKRPQENATVDAKLVALPNKIISKSRTKIVRMPMTMEPRAKSTSTTTTATSPLIKIGLRKLIRPNARDNVKITDPRPSGITATIKQYKIDRRIVTQRNPIRSRKTSFTGRYALRRSSEFPAKKITFRNPISLSFSKMPIKTLSSASSKNRQLQLLNINGVLYKSTRNKLERKDVSKAPVVKRVPVPKRTTGERAIFVRGTKYLLDKTGFNLTRVATTAQSTKQKSLRRIDIGGLTYVAKSKNVLVRTDTHLTRNHVSSAKHKSIQVLSRRFVKTNIPCPIFRRVGKCAAFESGKCMKVHDKMHVAICSKFLRGECISSSCLLSHNVSLSKMPVCKFYLQGLCVREDCPYLHKKLSAKAEICTDFLTGFCKLAQECNKRHEFVCPDVDAKGKCEKVKCSYCRKQQPNFAKRKSNILPKNISKKTTPNTEKQEQSDEPCVGTRYFAADTAIDLGEKTKECNEDRNSEESDAAEEVSYPTPKKRPQLGELPAFIPLS